MVGEFLSRLKTYRLDGFARVLLLPSGVPQDLSAGIVYGCSRETLRCEIAGSDMLWNFAAAIRAPLLHEFRWRVLIDGDPGHLQVSALEWDLGIAEHDRCLTVGLNINGEFCRVPKLGVRWTPFSQPVWLPFWPQAPDPGYTAPFSSITHWNWGSLFLDGRELSISKRDAYLRLATLPSLTSRPFTLATMLDSTNDPAGDRAIMEAGGWKIVHSWEVAGSPEAYRDFIAASRAEICAPKPVYTALRTGWVSDRSSAYLALGRPVVMEDTGLQGHLPIGTGLLTFTTVEEAAERVREVDRDYEKHSRAAREIAEEFFSSDHVIPKMLKACQ